MIIFSVSTIYNQLELSQERESLRIAVQKKSWNVPVRKYRNVCSVH